MDWLALSFSALSIIAIVISLFTGAFLGLFFLSLLVASPYVLAGSVSVAIIFRLLLRPQPVIALSLGALVFMIWLLYSLIGGLSTLSPYFLSQFIQLLFIALLCTYFQNESYSADRQQLIVVAFVFSGVLLFLLKILTEALEITVDSSALLKTEPSNYAALYTVLTLFIAPTLVRFQSYPREVAFKISAYSIGFYNIVLNDGRAALVTAAIVILSSNANLFRISALSVLAIIIVSLTAGISLGLGLGAVNDPKSIMSLLNFDQNFSNLERLALLKLSVETLLDHPFGLGLGSSATIFLSNAVSENTHYPHPHNTIAHLGVEFGWFGVFLYLCFLYYIGKKWRSANSSAVRSYYRMYFLGFLLLSQAEAISYNGLVMFFFCISFFLGSLNESDSKKT